MVMKQKGAKRGKLGSRALLGAIGGIDQYIAQIDWCRMVRKTETVLLGVIALCTIPAT